jgi:hypothetical protein
MPQWYPAPWPEPSGTPPLSAHNTRSSESSRQLRRARTQPATATARRATIRPILRAGLRPGRAIQQLIASLAARDARVRTLEDAGRHIRRAARAHDAHAAAIHVDFPAHVDDAFGREGEFAPRLAHLAVDELSVGEDGGPGAGLAVGEGDGDVAAGGHGEGDEWCIGVYPGGGGAPDGEHEVFAGGIDELVGVGAVFANPDAGA